MWKVGFLVRPTITVFTDLQQARKFGTYLKLLVIKNGPFDSHWRVLELYKNKTPHLPFDISSDVKP